MVLTSRNSGKYASMAWVRERGRCMMDKSRYTAAEQEYYEVDGSNVYEGTYQRLLDTLGNLQTTPADSATISRKYDQRDKPEVGY